jgi:hypothetical protein
VRFHSEQRMETGTVTELCHRTLGYRAYVCTLGYWAYVCTLGYRAYVCTLGYRAYVRMYIRLQGTRTYRGCSQWVKFS